MEPAQLNSNSPSASVQYALSVHARKAERVLSELVAIYQTRASALLVREPLLDPNTPACSDLDLIAFAEVDELLPQRIELPGHTGHTPLVDLIWLPAKILSQPEALVIQGVLPHRILSSRLIHDHSGEIAGQIETLAGLFYRPDLQSQRIRGLLQLGADAVREVGVTQDFPGLALFWLHMAGASLLSALADGAGLLCPNVYTRPFDHVAGIEQAYGIELENILIKTLHLDQDFESMIPRLRQVHNRVSQAFAEPAWPDNMRQCTRYEYRYFASADELEWRIRVAQELALNGKPWAAVFSLRFWAYMLACLPMVFQRAMEGIDVSFVRPQRAVRPDLEKHCPQILHDLEVIFGESQGVDLDAVESAVRDMQRLRAQTAEFLAGRGLDLDGSPPWQPWQREMVQHLKLNHI